MSILLLTIFSFSLAVLGTLWAVRRMLLHPLWARMLDKSSSRIAANEEKDGKRPVYPVKYLSERNSHSLLRIVPWDASGMLSETDTGFQFVGASRGGRPLEMSFSSDEAKINYQRGNLLWDGGVSWCVIEVEGEKHYFTSDAKIGDPSLTQEEWQGSNEVNTTVIYRNITNRYIRSS